jgi:hypothetical protein
MSSLKTILLLAGLAVAMGAAFNVKGLKVSHGLGIGIALVVIGSLIPDSTPAAS